MDTTVSDPAPDAPGDPFPDLDPDERRLLARMAARARSTGRPVRDLDVIHRWLRADGPHPPPADTDPRSGPAAAARVPDDDEVALVKEYPGAPVALPAGARPLPVDLSALVAGRTSCYRFAERELPLDDLAALLHAGAGVKDIVESPEGTVPLRMAPSAGSLQPVNLYVAARRVAGLDPGVYYYEPLRHALDRVRTTDPGPALAAGCMQDFVATSPATLILTCSLDRVLWHYGSRAYRSVHLDAGVLAQNLMLVATALGLASCAVFGYFDDHLDHLAGIDGRDEVTALLLALGHPDA